MFCLTQHKLDRQLKLFIDYKHLTLLRWGTLNNIEEFLLEKEIAFSANTSDICNSGWDYIVGDDIVYLVLDLNWNFRNIEPLMILFDDELESLLGLVAHLKSQIRDLKLIQLDLDKPS